MASQKARRPPSVDCSSAAIAARANKRRFVNLLQQLGRVAQEGGYVIPQVRDNTAVRNLRWLFAFAVISAVLLFAFAPRIPQPQKYHGFADTRELIPRIPNTLNVVSNAGFAAAGL